MNNKFAENLKRIRKENNLSQEQLADELGVSRQAISKWESALAYPEMDKIIALCDKFNLNIDDLLHKNIKEVKGEYESKKKINSFIDDFLKFITNTINMFSSMNLKSKIKCLFEQSIISIILLIISFIIFNILNDIFNKLLYFLPDKIYYFINCILESTLILTLITASVIIITHIFKTRYLDYYDKIKKELNNKEIDNNEKESSNSKTTNKLSFNNNDNKIIIRDPKHSEYKFINSLLKIIIGIIKFFLLCFGLFICFILVCLFGSFVVSFLLYKTGVFFIGVLITSLSSSVITIIILLIILNFVFNRKNDKKKMIYTFIISLITFGIGCGLIFNGILSFEFVKDDFKTITKEYEMKDDVVVFPYNNYAIEYVESENNNIKIEYKINKECSLYDYYEDNIISSIVVCENKMKIVKKFIKNINDKKILLYNSNIEKITIYTNNNNIEKIKDNIEKYYEKSNYYDEDINYDEYY